MQPARRNSTTPTANPNNNSKRTNNDDPSRLYIDPDHEALHADSDPHLYISAEEYQEDADVYNATSPPLEDMDRSKLPREPSPFRRHMRFMQRVLSAKLFNGIDSNPDQFAPEPTAAHVIESSADRSAAWLSHVVIPKSPQTLRATTSHCHTPGGDNARRSHCSGADGGPSLAARAADIPGALDVTSVSSAGGGGSDDDDNYAVVPRAASQPNSGDGTPASHRRGSGAGPLGFWRWCERPASGRTQLPSAHTPAAGATPTGGLALSATPRLSSHLLKLHDEAQQANSSSAATTPTPVAAGGATVHAFGRTSRPSLFES